MCSCSSKSVTKLQNGKSNGRVAVKMCGKPWCLPVFTIQMRHPSKPQQLKHTFDGWYRLVRYVKRMYPLHVPEFPLTLTRITCSYNHSSRRLSHCRLGVVTPPKRERNNNLISTFIYIIYIYTPLFSGSDSVVVCISFGSCKIPLALSGTRELYPRTRRGVPRRCHAATGAAQSQW